MTILYVTPHPLGVLLQTHLSPAERDALGDVSELLCQGDTFGGLSFEGWLELAGINGGKVDADKLRVD